MPNSIPLLLAVFILGFALGALLVAIQRRTRIENLKQEFQAQLEAIVEHTNTSSDGSTDRRKPSSTPDKMHADRSRAA